MYTLCRCDQSIPHTQIRVLAVDGEAHVTAEDAAGACSRLPLESCTQADLRATNCPRAAQCLNFRRLRHTYRNQRAAGQPQRLKHKCKQKRREEDRKASRKPESILQKNEN